MSQRDPEVLVFQKRYRDVGLYKGEIDGDFGPKCLAAALAAVADRKTIEADPGPVNTAGSPDYAFEIPVSNPRVTWAPPSAQGWLDKAVEILKEFEGFRSTAYYDRKAYSIGYGTQTYPDGSRVKRGDTCTRSQALEWMRHDILKVRAPAVESLVTVPLKGTAIAALVSFAYNVGTGGLADSSLLKAINAGKGPDVIAKEFAKYRTSNGQVLDVLVRRRADEAELFNS